MPLAAMPKKLLNQTRGTHITGLYNASVEGPLLREIKSNNELSNERFELWLAPSTKMTWPLDM